MLLYSHLAIHESENSHSTSLDACLPLQHNGKECIPSIPADDFGNGAAEEQQASPAIPPSALAMDTHEALRIVSTHYKRRVLAFPPLHDYPPVSVFEILCMFIQQQYDAFLAAELQGIKLRHSFNGGSQEEKEAQTKKEKEGTQTPQET